MAEPYQISDVLDSYLPHLAEKPSREAVNVTARYEASSLLVVATFNDGSVISHAWEWSDRHLAFVPPFVESAVAKLMQEVREKVLSAVADIAQPDGALH